MAKNYFSKITANSAAYGAEFFGTFVFTLVSTGVFLNNHLFGDLGIVGVAIASGFAYIAMVFATVHISGGHLNPVVSLALWFSRKLQALDLFFYLFAQFLGGLLAVVVLYYIFGSSTDFSLSTRVIGESISLQRAAVVEAIFSAILVFVYFATMVDRRGPSSFGPFALGSVVLFTTVFAFPLSGGFINPVRALVGAVLSSSYAELSVWIIGPLAGSLFGVVYEFLFTKKTSK